MKNTYVSPSVKVSHINDVMLSVSGNEGGPQYIEQSGFDNDKPVLQGLPTMPSANNIWDEEEESEPSGYEAETVL